LGRAESVGDGGGDAHTSPGRLGHVPGSRLRDPDSNELFAEAPITSPLHTCVERAIDSSRYFCVRVVDGGSGKHAFIGLGFTDSGASWGFLRGADRSPAVCGATRAGEGGGGTSGGAGAQPLQPGLTLKLNSNAGLSHGGGFVSGGSSKQGSLAKTFSLMFAENGGVEAALSSASNDSSPSPHGVAGPGRETTDASVGTEACWIAVRWSSLKVAGVHLRVHEVALTTVLRNRSRESRGRQTPELQKMLLPSLADELFDFILAVLVHFQAEALDNTLLGECLRIGEGVIDVREDFVGGVEVNGRRGLGLEGGEYLIEVARLYPRPRTWCIVRGWLGWN
jgi:hypothetical protein